MLSVSIILFVAKRGPGVVVSEKVFPAPECAILFVVSCLAFRFVSSFVTRGGSFHR